MPEEKDSAQAKLQEVSIKPGDIFRHYKGDKYEVVTLAIKEDTLEPLVIYRSQQGDIWARTYANWSEKVEINGESVPRFQKIN